MSDVISVGDYLKRAARQLRLDLRREAGGIVIGLLAIIVLLIIQFEVGWIMANNLHQYRAVPVCFLDLFRLPPSARTV